MTDEEEKAREFIIETFDSCFVEALAQSIKEAVFPRTDEESVQKYRDEILQKIVEGVSRGTEVYLQEKEADSISNILKEIIDEFQMEHNDNGTEKNLS